MTIIDKIMESVRAAVEVDGEPIPVYYHDDATLNAMASTMELPCCLVRLLTTGSVAMEGGQLKERVTAAVFFVERAEFDFDAVTNEASVHRSKARAFAWLGSLGLSPLLELERVASTSRVYDRFDDPVTGFGVMVDLKELTGMCDPSSVCDGASFNEAFSEAFEIWCN